MRQLFKEIPKKIKYRFLVSIALLITSFLLLALAAKSRSFADAWATQVYALLVSVIARIFGYFPFSVSELLICVILAGLVFFTIRLIVRLYKKGDPARLLTSFGSGFLLTVSILFFLYVTCCGINYRRTSFAEMIGAPTGQEAVDPRQLLEVCVYLTSELREISDSVPRYTDAASLPGGIGAFRDKAEGTMILDQREAKDKASKLMTSLGDTYPCMKGFFPKPKGLAISEFLSWQGLTGIYLPFTIEANYNADMPAYNIPLTMCHELSHLRGFMQEEEANFIAYLACLSSEDVEFRYSGLLLGWIYCTNDLYKFAPEYVTELRKYFPKEIRQELRANSTFWDHYEGPANELQNKLNDAYLKSNGQRYGVLSYSHVVQLIVWDYFENRR